MVNKNFALRRLAVKVSVCLLAAVALTAHAQLSSPIGDGPALPGSIDLPAGQGAGVHGANSPYAPLPQRLDVVPWSVLTDVKTKKQNNRILPVFTASQTGLDQKTQLLQGFMMPLEAGQRHRHFLLSSVPLTCAFCLPGGPESMVEVRTKVPVKYTMEPVVVEGKFEVLKDDPMGLYYRITSAASIR